MFCVVSVLFLGSRCHLGVFRNIVRGVSFSCFGEHTQKQMLRNMRRLYLKCILTTLFRTVSNIWSIMQFNG